MGTQIKTLGLSQAEVNRQFYRSARLLRRVLFRFLRTGFRWSLWTVEEILTSMFRRQVVRQVAPGQTEVVEYECQYQQPIIFGE